MKKALILSVIVLFTQNSFSQSSAASSENVNKVEAKSLPFAMSFKSEVSSNVETAKTVGGGLSEHQLRLSYKIDEMSQVGLLLGGKYVFTGEGQNQQAQEFMNSDIAIAGIYAIPEVLGADKLEIDGRIYLPTSENSKAISQNYLLRADLKMPYSFENNQKVVLLTSPRFFDYEIANSKLDVQSQARYAIGKSVVPYLAINHRLIMLDENGLARSNEYMGPELGLELSPTSYLKVSMLVAQERNILNPGANSKTRKNYSAFDTAETKYFVNAQVKL